MNNRILKSNHSKGSQRSKKGRVRIRITGQWLDEIGFSIGKYATISFENGYLVFRLAEKKAEIEESI